MSLIRVLVLFVFGVLFSGGVYAADLELITSETQEGDVVSYSASLTAMMIMTFIALIPTIIITMTAFLRVTIVLSITRQALGLTTSPSTKVIVAISLVLTFYIMNPVLEKVKTDAYIPLKNETITFEQSIEEAYKPLRAFMMNQTRPKYLQTYLEVAGYSSVEKDDVPFSVLLISFITSEIQTALTVGFMIFLPFVVIDLIVASALMGMGMMMVSPMIISLPIKILVFVMVDGWLLVTKGVAGSFYMGGI